MPVCLCACVPVCLCVCVSAMRLSCTSLACAMHVGVTVCQCVCVSVRRRVGVSVCLCVGVSARLCVTRNISPIRFISNTWTSLIYRSFIADAPDRRLDVRRGDALAGVADHAHRQTVRRHRNSLAILIKSFTYTIVGYASLDCCCIARLFHMSRSIVAYVSLNCCICIAQLFSLDRSTHTNVWMA